MAGNRDDVISSYVRTKIREWKASGRELQALAKKAGFAKSTPSQVLLGTGVGAKTGPKFAKAFDFETYDAMKRAAWAWWQEQGEAGAKALVAPQTDALKKALELVRGMMGPPDSHLASILAAYAHPRFHDRDSDWWVTTLLTELKIDDTASKLDRVVAHQQVWSEKKRVTREQDAWRAGARERRKPAPRQETELPKKRRAAR